jgi:CRP/FNR family cyclic AMP-dependent transcriptional regulator
MVTCDTSREAKLLASFFQVKGKAHMYKKGRRLLSDDIAGSVVYIKSGFLAAYLVSQPNRAKARAYYVFGPGDLVQVRELVVGTHTDLHYSTLSNAVVYVIPRETMWSALEKNTALSAALLREVLLQNELHTRRIENLSYRYASDKLIYRILNLAERFGVPKDGTIHIRLPVTHREMGMFINMARESVSREMEKLVNHGLISYQRQRITILNPAALAEMLHEPIRTDWHEIVELAAHN